MTGLKIVTLVFFWYKKYSRFQHQLQLDRQQSEIESLKASKESQQSEIGSLKASKESQQTKLDKLVEDMEAMILEKHKLEEASLISDIHISSIIQAIST
jgi:hypothetical protein